jgi:hypothetical protein
MGLALPTVSEILYFSTKSEQVFIAMEVRSVCLTFAADFKFFCSGISFSWVELPNLEECDATDGEQIFVCWVQKRF